MHKFIKVLAVSFGSGVLLGAGIRVGETIRPRAVSAEKTSDPNSTDATGKSASGTVRREEVRAWVAEDLKTLLVNERKHMQEFLEAGPVGRMAQRVENLEDQFARHSQDIGELRDCSLRTERSLQRLLTGLDRFINSVPQPQGSEASRRDVAPEEHPPAGGQFRPAYEPLTRTAG